MSKETKQDTLKTKYIDVEDIFKSLGDVYSPEEIQELRQLYNNVRVLKKAKPKQIRPIVPIEEWLSSPYYLGSTAHIIYPYWKEQITNIVNSKVPINQVIFTGAIGCLKTDTLYSTSLGFKTLPELIDKDFSIKSELTTEQGIATNKHILGIKPTKKVTLENGTILEGTLNHRVKVLENNQVVWKRFDELKEKDIIIHSRKLEPFGNKEMDLDEAYMIGSLLGDGYCKYFEDKNTHLISITLLKNISNYEKVKTIFTKLYGTPSISVKNKRAVSFRKHNNEFKNLPYWEYVSRRSDSKEIPKYILEYNKEVIGSLLQGLFDTDGSCSDKGGNIEYASVSLNLITQVKRLLAAYGINSKLSLKVNTLNNKQFTSYRLIIRGVKDLSLFRKYIGFSIDYKQNNLINIIERDNKNQRIYLDGVLDVIKEHHKTIPITGARKLGLGGHYSSSKNKQLTERVFDRLVEYKYDWLSLNPTLKYLADIDFYTVKVSKIEDSEAEVGDIEVPTTHCYNIGGIVSHNTGKSTAAVILLIRRIYELSCYENIPALFDLMAVSRIAFAYISVTKDQAQNTGFSKLTDMIDDIPYFKEHFPRKTTLNSAIVFPTEGVFVLAGSILNHFIGLDVIGSILDEANFFEGADREAQDMKMNSKAAMLYSQLQTRASSRFIVKGENKSLSILVSSSTTSSSFIEDRISRAAGDPHTYIASPAIWDVKPQQFTKGRFYLYLGGEGIDPFVIDSISGLNTILINNKLPQVGGIGLDQAYEELDWSIKQKIMKVPNELMTNFRDNIHTALQNLAGFSVTAANKFFNSATAFNQCIDTSISHPFIKESIPLSTTKIPSQEGYIPLHLQLDETVTFKNKKAPHFIHLDLSLTGDSTGIAMAHISDWQVIRKGQNTFAEEQDFMRYDKKSRGIDLSKVAPVRDEYIYDIADEDIKMPIITVDMMLQILPPKKPNQISYSKIRDFIIHLRDEVGINIELITFDQFQSAQLRQELTEVGFNTAYLSVDRTEDPYMSLANLFYDKRIRIYNYAPFRHELFNLIHYRARKKIDHPNKMSKDVSDAVAGAVFSAITSEDKTKMGDTQDVNNLFLAANLSDDEQYKAQVKNKLNELLKLL